MHDIVDTAVAAGTFKTLAAAVTAAGLAERAMDDPAQDSFHAFLNRRHRWMSGSQVSEIWGTRYLNSLEFKMNLNLRHQPFGVLVRDYVFLYFSFSKCFKIRNLR